MINFSNMTLDEFINLNYDNISKEILPYIYELQQQIKKLKEDIEKLEVQLDML